MITVNRTAHWHAPIGKAEYLTDHLLAHGLEDYLVRLFLCFEQEDTQGSRKKHDAE